MSLILDGTNGLSDVDGSAATPAIRGSDANTGVFFGADQVGIATNGVERVEFGNSETVFNDGGANVDFRVEGDTVSNLLFVDASADNVGIGTSSPAAGVLLDLKQPTAGTDLIIGLSAGTGARAQIRSVAQGSADDSVLSFQTTSGGSTVERARIDSSGNLLVGSSGATSARLFVEQAVNDHMTRFNNSQASGVIYGPLIRFTGQAPNSVSSEFLACLDTGAYRMVVRSNGGIANFSGNNVNLSDRREKTNFAPAKSYLDTICAIPVQTFNYIDQNLEEDPGLTLGVVAQDVQEVAPELVMESNWGTAEEPKMRLSIYQTDLQYALMKCIQELKGINDAQAQIITALTARVEALEGAQ
jgi:hypothetical protein